jgi:Flp pilus assembly protein TadG
MGDVRSKLSARRRRRGAAMVEALVAIPFFIVIFAVTMFVGQFYNEKLRTMRESKRCAWDHAMNGCKGGCNADTASAGSGTETQPPQGTGDSKSDSAPQSNITSKDYYQSKFTVKSKATASNTIGGWVRNIESTTTVMCDEQPEDGDPIGIAKYLWNNGSSW